MDNIAPNSTYTESLRLITGGLSTIGVSTDPSVRKLSRSVSFGRCLINMKAILSHISVLKFSLPKKRLITKLLISLPKVLMTLSFLLKLNKSLMPFQMPSCVHVRYTFNKTLCESMQCFELIFRYLNLQY